MAAKRAGNGEPKPTEPEQAQSSRHKRKYESRKKVEKWKDVDDVQGLKECLGAWMRDLHAWGEDVRDDIIRLETAVRAAPGEPGDPPPAPRKQ
jgi:hypothetical protein